MANHRKKPGYHGCRMCNPHKMMGNSKEATKPKYWPHENKRRQIELESD